MRRHACSEGAAICTLHLDPNTCTGMENPLAHFGGCTPQLRIDSSTVCVCRILIWETLWRTLFGKPFGEQ